MNPNVPSGDTSTPTWSALVEEQADAIKLLGMFSLLLAIALHPFAGHKTYAKRSRSYDFAMIFLAYLVYFHFVNMVLFITGIPSVYMPPWTLPLGLAAFFCSFEAYDVEYMHEVPEFRFEGLRPEKFHSYALIVCCTTAYSFLSHFGIFELAIASNITAWKIAIALVGLGMIHVSKPFLWDPVVELVARAIGSVAIYRADSVVLGSTSTTAEAWEDFGEHVSNFSFTAVGMMILVAGLIQFGMLMGADGNTP